MSIFSFFSRFTITYTLVMAAVGITMGLLGVEKASSLNTPILMGISFWCFYSYSIANSRIVEGGERWKLVFAALLGDVIASLLLGVPALIVSDTPIHYTFLGMAIVIPFHALLFVVVSYIVKKPILKKYPELEQS
ncbi:hypothetical protein HXX02_07445 [Microbulbifer elongatus]|uniref:Uncharacterized protein n=1 Tax=Microbulbifer elongatus TaxID=86173 RepID=A0ABT1P2N1_9GAMM|nr:ABZJ_00895 family protein [Microbulbifer elongatus]MCQ3829276.1 hypothetical protein [Microbulbifer elongatus]